MIGKRWPTHAAAHKRPQKGGAQLTRGTVINAKAADSGRTAPALEGAGVVRLLIYSVAAIVFIACAAALPMALGHHDPGTQLTQYYFLRQDLPLLLPLTLSLLALSALPFHAQFPKVNARGLAIGAATVGLCCYAGHYFLLAGADLTADETLANFDAQIFSMGRLFQPIPDEWRPYAEALNLNFILPVSGNAGWVSSYLPGNAAIRMVAGLAGDPALASPLLVVLGGYALFRICRRLWPGDDEALLIALPLYALSGQVVFTGMTAYAMNAHLALNLVWLWLFLMRRPVADVGALAVGFIATGLHQPVFHPLFAIAFLAPLPFERKWARSAFFAAGYAAIILFWIKWPVFVSGLAAGGAGGAGGADYIGRLGNLKLGLTPDDFQIMAMNVIRFVTWQHLLFFPLFVVGVATSLKSRNLTGISCLASIALTAIAMTALLSYQGHGWGYRYFHGVIGGAIVLAVYGYKSLNLSPRRRFGLFAAASLATLAIVAPVEALFIGSAYRSYAKVDAAIARTDTDLVIVDDLQAPFALDLIHNRPDLSNRPLRLVGSKLDEGAVKQLCARGPSIAYIGGDIIAPMRRLYHAEAPGSAPAASKAYQDALKAGCRAG
jgi:hypothetical protein